MRCNVRWPELFLAIFLLLWMAATLALPGVYLIKGNGNGVVGAVYLVFWFLMVDALVIVVNRYNAYVYEQPAAPSLDAGAARASSLYATTGLVAALAALATLILPWAQAGSSGARTLSGLGLWLHVGGWTAYAVSTLPLSLLIEMAVVQIIVSWVMLRAPRVAHPTAPKVALFAASGGVFCVLLMRILIEIAPHSVSVQPTPWLTCGALVVALLADCVIVGVQPAAQALPAPGVDLPAWAPVAGTWVRWVRVVTISVLTLLAFAMSSTLFGFHEGDLRLPAEPANLDILWRTIALLIALFYVGVLSVAVTGVRLLVREFTVPRRALWASTPVPPSRRRVRWGAGIVLVASALFAALFLLPIGVVDRGGGSTTPFSTLDVLLGDQVAGAVFVGVMLALLVALMLPLIGMSATAIGSVADQRPASPDLGPTPLRLLDGLLGIVGVVLAVTIVYSKAFATQSAPSVVTYQPFAMEILVLLVYLNVVAYGAELVIVGAGGPRQRWRGSRQILWRRPSVRTSAGPAPARRAPAPNFYSEVFRRVWDVGTPEDAPAAPAAGADPLGGTAPARPKRTYEGLAGLGCVVVSAIVVITQHQTFFQPAPGSPSSSIDPLATWVLALAVAGVILGIRSLRKASVLRQLDLTGTQIPALLAVGGGAVLVVAAIVRIAIVG